MGVDTFILALVDIGVQIEKKWGKVEKAFHHFSEGKKRIESEVFCERFKDAKLDSKGFSPGLVFTFLNTSHTGKLTQTEFSVILSLERRNEMQEGIDELAGYLRELKQFAENRFEGLYGLY